MRNLLIVSAVAAMCLPSFGQGCDLNTEPLGCIDVLDSALDKELIWGPAEFVTGGNWMVCMVGPGQSAGGFDAAGNFYTLNGQADVENSPREILRIAPNGDQEVIAVSLTNGRGNPNSLSVDSVNGRIYLCQGAGGGGLGSMVALTGLPILFDVFQTFVPDTTSLAFTVPAMPEGMGGADHFDTYTGTIGNYDFSQAQSLQCNYPMPVPEVGDYLTVADTLPTPTPGTGRWYLTAVNYQGETRYGRKNIGGVLSGRDPAVLPVCQE